MSLSEARSGHRPQLSPIVHRHLPSKGDGANDHVSLSNLVEEQRKRIEQLEALLEPLASAESWALAWAREHEPWNRIRKVLNQ